jgi:hypothetical protein
MDVIDFSDSLEYKQYENNDKFTIITDPLLLTERYFQCNNVYEHFVLRCPLDLDQLPNTIIFKNCIFTQKLNFDNKRFNFLNFENCVFDSLSINKCAFNNLHFIDCRIVNNLMIKNSEIIEFASVNYSDIVCKQQSFQLIDNKITNIKIQRLFSQIFRINQDLKGHSLEMFGLSVGEGASFDLKNIVNSNLKTTDTKINIIAEFNVQPYSIKDYVLFDNETLKFLKEGFQSVGDFKGELWIDTILGKNIARTQKSWAKVC